jgi:hypothetical protein
MQNYNDFKYTIFKQLFPATYPNHNKNKHLEDTVAQSNCQNDGYKAEKACDKKSCPSVD